MARPKKTYLSAAQLVESTSLSRMSISRKATSGEIPGACHPSTRANWRFEKCESLERWIKSQAVSAERRKRIRPYQRMPRKWEKVRAGETYFPHYLEALEEIIGIAAKSREDWNKHYGYLIYAMLRLEWYRQKFDRIERAYDDVLRIADPEHYNDTRAPQG